MFLLTFIAGWLVQGGRIDPTQLAIDREQFGEIEPKTKFETRFTFAHGPNGYPTRIIFPEGKADERFYVSGRVFPGNAFLNSYNQRFLQYETKHNGKIKAEWETELMGFSRDPVDLPESMDKAGSLIKALYRNGLKTRVDLPKVVADRLAKQEGFANYSIDMPLGEDLFYWFTDRRGNTSPRKSISLREIQRITGKSVVSMPTLGIPYPITEEETTDLRNLASKG